MFDNCTVGSLDNSEGMKRVRGWYPDKDPNYLADAIEAWRRQDNRRTQDSYPMRKDFFSRFLKKFDKQRRKSARSTKTREQVLAEHTSLHTAFRQSELKNRSRLVSDIFTQIVNEYINIDRPGIDRKTAIEELGGPMGILSIIKNEDFTDASDLQYWLDVYEKDADAEDKARYMSTEYQKMVDNFSDIALRAAEYIKVNENISIDAISLKENLEKMEELDKDADREDNPVGERYDLDYKSLMPHETLSVETKKIISGIAMVDDEGKTLHDDLGYDMLYDPIQVQSVISRIGTVSDHETFMRNLRDAEYDYPWMAALIEALEKDDHARTTFMNDFIKDMTFFMGVYRKLIKIGDSYVEHYAPSLANTRASRNSLIREINHTLIEGLVLNRKGSIYDDNGFILRPATVHPSSTSFEDRKKMDREYFDSMHAMFSDMFDDYKKALSETIKRENGKGKLTKSELSERWRDSHKEEVALIKDALRSVGIDVNMKMLEKTFGSTLYRDKKIKKKRGGFFWVKPDAMWDVLSGLKELYAAARDGVGNPADSFYIKVDNKGTYHNVQRTYENLGKALSSSVVDDVELRALVNGKTYSSITTPNLLNQVFKKFETKYGDIAKELDANPNIKDEQKNKMRNEMFDKWMMEEFGYEGNVITEESVDEFGRPAKKTRFTGWMKDAKGKKFSVVDFANFCDEGEYEKLSPLQKFISTYTFQMQSSSLGEFLYETSTLSDYTVNNFIRHAILATGNKALCRYDAERGGYVDHQIDDEAVDAVVDEILCEIERMDAARKRYEENEAVKEYNKNEKDKKKHKPLPHPDFGPYSDRARFFQIFPSFNSDNPLDDVYMKYKKLLESENSYAAVRFLKEKVCEALMEVIADDYVKASKLGFFNEDQFASMIVDEDARENELNGLGSDEERAAKKAEWNASDVVLADGLPAMTAKGFEEFMKFSVNTFYGRQQIAKIMGLDPSWFISHDDMLKRFMMMHAPGTPVDYTAKWKGEQVGKDDEVCVYLQDSKESSAYLDEYEEMLSYLVGNGISEKQKNQFLSEYRKITETDGQAFRTLKSFREVRIMMGDGAWNDEFDAAYQRMMGNHKYQSDEELKKDLDLFMFQNIKPVVTGYEKIKLDNGDMIKVPVLHKNSEAVLLPAKFYDYGILQAKASYLKALAIAAEDEGIDAFIYESSAKVGNHSSVSSLNERLKDDDGNPILDENGKEQYAYGSVDEMVDHIKGSIQASRFVKHNIPYKYYRIAASMPVHMLDQIRAWGQQSIKTMMVDFADDEQCVVNGKKIDVKDAKSLFQKLQTATLVEAYDNLKELFKDPDRMEEVLQQELATKDYNSPELREILTMLNNGTFVIAPFNPAVTRLAQQLLMSIMRKRMVRTSSRGGSAIVQSSIGLDNGVLRRQDDVDEKDMLHVVFEGEGENLHIKHVECYLPIYDSRLAQFADKYGNISAERLEKLVAEKRIPESMLNFIGFRSPADAPHSTIPFHVKGFKANIAGGSIMAPRDLMVMLGQDFDGDKILMHFKDFAVVDMFDEVTLKKSYSIHKMNSVGRVEKDQVMSEEQYLNGIYSFYENNSFEGIAASMLTLERHPELFYNNREEFENEVYRVLEEYEAGDDSDLKKYISAVKKDGIKPYCKEYKYDYSKEPYEQDKKAIDNAMIDIMFGIQTSPQGSRRLIMPGGFEETKSIAMAIQLTNALKQRGEKVSAERFNRFVSMGSGWLSKELKKYQTKKSPFTESFAIDSFVNIMKGKLLVSRLALYNAGFALLQGSGIHMYAHTKKENKAVHMSLFKNSKGQPYVVDELFKVMDRTGKGFSSRIFSQVINAGVDNGKCPILGDVNLNEDTIDFFAAMVASGFTQEDIIVFMNHPLFREISEAKIATNGYLSFAKIADSRMSELRKLLPEDQPVSDQKALDYLGEIDRKTFIESIGEDARHDDIMFELGMLAFIKHMDNASSDIKDLVQVLRPDTASGSISSTIGEHLEKIRRIDNIITKNTPGKTYESYINIPENVMDMITPVTVEPGTTKEGISQLFANAFNPYISALNTLAQRECLEYMKRYFPQADQTWVDTILDTYELCYHKAEFHKDTLFDQMINELISFMLLKDNRITRDVDGDRDKYVNGVPKTLKAIKTELKNITTKIANGEQVTDAERALSENVFLKRLYVWQSGKVDNDIAKIQFEVGGSITSSTTEDIRQSWGDLLRFGMLGDIDISEFATDLFKYALFSDGFGYGMYTFSQFAPLSIMISTPGYADALDNLIGSSIDPQDKERFKVQYGCNHAFNRQVAPLVDGESKINPHIADVAKDDTWIQMKNDFEGMETEGFYVIRGKKGDRLYLYKKEEGEPGMFYLYPALGRVTKKNQFFYQYNPRLDAKDMKKFESTVLTHLAQMERDFNNERAELGDGAFDAKQVEKANAVQAPPNIFGTSRGGIAPSQVAGFNAEGRLAAKAKSVKPNTPDNFEANAVAAAAANDNINVNTATGSSSLDPTTAEFFSGEANGSDKAWAAVARRHGINVTEYTTESYDALPVDKKRKYNDEYLRIRKILNRYFYPENIYEGKLVRRNMMQADAADAVFAIGTIANDGYVDGGTGYATTRGIQRGIPVYLFDQSDSKWKVWNGNAFVETSMPRLTPRAAVIGTRKIRENGMKAINDIIEASLGIAVQQSTSQPEVSGPSEQQLAALGGEVDMTHMPPKSSLFSLARTGTDEKGNDVTYIEEVPATPANVAEARKQKAYVLLNKRLREILQKAGVSVGYLTEIERRAGINGVAEFDRAKIAAEGLSELIRIANNIQGEMALPEEFAHAALYMLGRNHPMVSRLVKSLTENHQAIKDVFGEDYDRYMSVYDGNLDKMAVEAAGKLVAKHLLQRQMIDQKSTFGKILSRLINILKDAIRKISGRDVRIAIKASDDMASDIAKGFLEGDLADELSKDRISESVAFKTTIKMIDGKEDILNKLLKRSMANLKLYNRRMAYSSAKGFKVVDATKHSIDVLQNGIRFNKVDLSIVKYLENTLNMMQSAEESLDTSVSEGHASEAICRKLNSIRDMIFGFAQSLDDIREYLSASNEETRSNIMPLLENATALMNEFNVKYNRIAMTQFLDFIRGYYGDSVTIPIGKYKGKVVTVEELAKYASSDISMLSRWLDSLADTPDLLNKVFDESVREQKYAARTDTLNLRTRVEAAVRKLEDATGSRDTSFMFHKNAEGKRSGRYLNKKEAEVMLNKAQLEYYNFFIAEKEALDKNLPSAVTGTVFNTIKIREKSLSKAFNKLHDNKFNPVPQLFDKFEEALLEDDDINIEVDEVLVDFQGNRVDSLPIKYCKKGKGESEDQMSMDTATSLVLYAGMANNYARLNSIIGSLENARYMAKNRDVQEKNGDRNQLETISNESFSYQRNLTKKQAKSMLNDALDDFFMMHVYGHMQKEEGTFGNTRLSKQKAARALNRASSLSTMWFNFLNRITNVTEGFFQIVPEMAGGEFFDMKDYYWAVKQYMKDIPDMIVNIGNPTNDNKLYLWNEMFDVQQENDRSYGQGNYAKEGLSRLSLGNIGYFGLTAGEHVLSSTTSLSVAHRFMLKNSKGEKKNLWDAMEVAYTDPKTKSGAFLKVKDGFTKLDGTEFTYDDMMKFSKKCAGLSFRLQGIYNVNDRSPINARSWGALIIMYRKWMKPAFVRRYGKASYNNLTETWDEGYWRTTGRFLAQVAKDFDHMSTAIRLNWENLNEYEKSNMRKAVCEIGILVGSIIAIALLDAIGDGDDDDDDWKAMRTLVRPATYVLYKVKNSIGSLIPGPEMPNELLKILSSPFAALRTIKSSIALLGVMLPGNWTEASKIKSGRYKGKYKGEKLLLEAPVISVWKNFANAMDQSDLIQYYANDSMF